MAGITRIKITDGIDGAGAYRFVESEKKQSAANQLYRKIFEELQCPLLEGDNKLQCSIDDIPAAYDRLLGIDVILTMANGMKATLQEKFLTTDYLTVTVEYYNNPAIQDEGDWFHMKANYYFVSYGWTKETNKFQSWMLLDWAAIQRATSQNRINWQENINRYDGARANFKYVPFLQIPEDCIIGGQLYNISLERIFELNWSLPNPTLVKKTGLKPWQIQKIRENKYNEST